MKHRMKFKEHYKTVSKTIQFADWVFLRDKRKWRSCHIQYNIINDKLLMICGVNYFNFERIIRPQYFNFYFIQRFQI